MAKQSSFRSLLFSLIALCISVALVWFVVEFGSFAALRIYYAVTSGQRDETAQKTKLYYLGSPLRHPLWNGFTTQEFSGQRIKPTDYSFDPFTGYRSPPDSTVHGWLGTDRYGFVHNGDPDRVIDMSPDTVRVILLGGSSMAGSGATSNDQTIGGHLERKLNNLRDGRRYQVINAGVGGFFTPLEAVYFMVELIHYRPSIVIMFDGFNDFHRSWPPHHTSIDRDGWAIPNRSEKQQSNIAMFARLNLGQPITDMLRDQSALTRIFFYSTRLLSDAIVKAGTDTPGIGEPETTLPHKLDPWPANAIWLRDNAYKSRSHANFMLSNWRSVAGIASANDIAIALLLQPMLPVSDRRFTAIEKKKVEMDSHINSNAYERSSKAFYQDVRARLPGLERDFAGNALVHIEDVSHILNEHPEPMFLDRVHPTHKGNQVIAEHMARIVTQLLNATNESAAASRR